MASDEQAGRKAKGKKGRMAAGAAVSIAEHNGRLETDDLEIIPTAVPREGDGYQAPDQATGGVTAGLTGLIGENPPHLFNPWSIFLPRLYCYK